MLAASPMERTNTEEALSGQWHQDKKEARLTRMGSVYPIRCVLLSEAQENAWDFMCSMETCTNHWTNPWWCTEIEASHRSKP